ncbi:MAG: peptidylprolyl isomerase [Dehalogenimonas sp.]|uniref:peptidylprolyl isomerase n=1 Tax=Candidatus Dehalogenimonas loeffleri TaxID=3127115 RepID=A0ABZ2J3U6_9CHLR|nr:peptidylprolyl isomerase [Dehalogenimonas sp.]
MAKKHKKHAQPHNVLSHKAKSKLAKQHQKQKVTRWIGLGIIGAVALVLSIGVIATWLIPVYIPLQQTVVSVNGTNYSASYVSKMVNFYTGGDPTYSYLYIDLVLGQIEKNQLMNEAAAELGITVSDKEVKEAIKAAGLDDNKVTRDIVTASLLYQKLNEKHFEMIVPLSGEQRQALVMLLESEAQAEAVKARLLNGESFADIAKELSLDDTTVTLEGDMGYHPPGFLDDKLGADGLDAKVDAGQPGNTGYFYDADKSKKLGYWVVKVTDRQTVNDNVQVQVYGILLPTVEKAQEARQRILDGEDFADVVEDMTQDITSKAKGGDLGLLTAGGAELPYSDYIFDENTLLDDLSAPIRAEVATTGAWWFYQVASVEQSKLYSEEDRNTLLDQAFTDWMDGLETDPANDIVRAELTDELKDLIAEQSLS